MCGFAWVQSIPFLMLVIGGALQPTVGWIGGIATAVCMFAVLVQFHNTIAFVSVVIVSFSASVWAGDSTTWAFALTACSLTLLNAIPCCCFSCPKLVKLQGMYLRGYSARCKLGGELDGITSSSFFACHPHGIFSIGWVSNVVFETKFHQAVGKCYYIIDSTLRNKGLLARIFLDAFEGSHGGFRDSSKETVLSLMSKGESVCMVPGAFQEATCFERGVDRVVLKNRKGFVKYCLKYGYKLHPVFCFGECETYRVFNGFRNFRLWLNNFGIPAVVPMGMWWLPMLPRPSAELLTFVGPALELPRIDEPTNADVDEWHGKYIVALQDLYNKHKDEAGRSHCELEVF